MIGLTYHKDYNKYDLGLDHPLIGDKPGKTVNYLEQKSLLKDIKVFESPLANKKDLLRVHKKSYIEKIKKLSKTGGTLSFDTPAPKGIYKYASLATGGTILCGKKLFQGFKIMINPLGGFHHASRDYSSGFCFFNDIAVVIEYLREKMNKKRFMIIDLDLHHANGTQEIYFKDPSVLNISFHQDGRTLYPGTGSIEKIGKEEGEGYTVNVPLPPKTGETSYLKAFQEIVPPLTEQFKPEIIIYQSGVDNHYADPLGRLKLTYQSFHKLSKKIKKLSQKNNDKLIAPMGGGYNSQASIISYYNIVCGLTNQKEPIKEKNIKDEKTKNVERIISNLKNKLKKHWNL